CLQLHSLDIDLEEIEPRKTKRIDRDRSDLYCGSVGIIDRLTDEFGPFALAQFQTREAAGAEVIRLRNQHGAGLRADRRVDGACVQQILYQDVPGNHKTPPLPPLVSDPLPPAVHALAPSDGIHAAFSPAVESHDPTAKILPPQREQPQCRIDFRKSVRAVSE